MTKIKQFYCHYEEKMKPADDFSLVVLSGRTNKIMSSESESSKVLPRAVCNTCLNQGHSLAEKYDYYDRLIEEKSIKEASKPIVDRKLFKKKYQPFRG